MNRPVNDDDLDQYTFPRSREGQSFFPGDVVCIRPLSNFPIKNCLVMRVTGTLPGSRVSVRWFSGNVEYRGTFEAWRLKLIRRA